MQTVNDVLGAVDRASDRCAKGVNDEIKAHVTFKGKKYIRAFKISKDKGVNHSKRTWYVKAPYYRLTHLLENGHATVNGGRTQAYPHIQYGEKFAQDNYENMLKEEIENVK